jgi:3-hydroxyisobutyrate dehydrogenase
VVGARPSALTKVHAVLDRLASTLTVVGDQPGAGQALKTVNQLLCGIHIAAAAEALALAAALGLDPKVTLDALQAAPQAPSCSATAGLACCRPTT